MEQYLSKLKNTFYIVNLENPKSFESALKGAHIVIHIAHISFSEKVIKTGIKEGIEWFICIHTTGRYSKFKSASKRYIEIEDNLLANYNNLTILRPTMIYGDQKDRNMWKLINYLNKNKFFPIFGSGRNLLQPVHSKDLGYAYLDVIKNKTKTFNQQYNLSGAEIIQYKRLLELISLQLNKRTIFIKIPIKLSLIIVYLLNKIPTRLFKSPIKVEQVKRMLEDKNFSNQKARIDFNFNPVSITKGISEEIKLYLEKI